MVPWLTWFRLAQPKCPVLLCDMLPLMDELSCQCAKFIANALDSDSNVVSYVARHGIYYGRMFLLLEIQCFAIMTLHLLLKILFVAMFGVLSLLMLFLLCAVSLRCFISDTDTLLSAFLLVMSLCNAICHLSTS